jgi:hypothetical protein
LNNGPKCIPSNTNGKSAFRPVSFVVFGGVTFVIVAGVVQLLVCVSMFVDRMIMRMAMTM